MREDIGLCSKLRFIVFVKSDHHWFLFFYCLYIQMRKSLDRLEISRWSRKTLTELKSLVEGHLVKSNWWELALIFVTNFCHYEDSVSGSVWIFWFSGRLHKESLYKVSCSYFWRLGICLNWKKILEKFSFFNVFFNTYSVVSST